MHRGCQKTVSIGCQIKIVMREEGSSRRTPESISYILNPELRLVRGVRDGPIYMTRLSHRSEWTSDRAYPRHRLCGLDAETGGVIGVEDLFGGEQLGERVEMKGGTVCRTESSSSCV